MTNHEAREPLLDGEHADCHVGDSACAATPHAEDRIHCAEVLKSAGAQAQLAWPLLLNLVAGYSVGIITLSFIGHLGKHELAAASMALSLVGLLARTVILGLVGALDTQASQAFGAGNYKLLGVLYQRTVLFNLAHCVPMTLAVLAAPRVLALGQAGDAGGGEALHLAVARYLHVLLPGMWMDAIARPLNSILVAQRITKPQALVSLLVLPIHVANNWFFIHYLKFGYLGAAMATLLVQLYSITFVIIYVWASGLGPRVMGPPTWEALRGWRAHASLAWPACIMQCAESWGFSIVTVASGFLPDPETSVAAISAAFGLYGVGYMSFVSLRMSASVQVGNALGAGDAHKAVVGIIAALCLGPLFWTLVAVALVEPHSQMFLMLIFTDGQDPALLAMLRGLLYIVVALEAFDGMQTILSGVIQGAGKQRYGSMVNVLAFWVVAIPLALLLGFKLHLGTNGLYLGMLAGPVLQTFFYLAIIYRIHWKVEAEAAARRMAAASGPGENSEAPVLVDSSEA